MGYPVAGGSLHNGLLDGVLFDHVMLERQEKSKAGNYEQIQKLFTDMGIQLETPFDMLEWIWLHMAVNAGVITTAGKYGSVTDTVTAAEMVMESSKALAEAVISIRETAGIIESRQVVLKRYWNELLPYWLPSRLAGIIMKRMFRKNELTRRIMTLHSNLEDLLYVCRSVYECGRKNQVEAPVFYNNYERIQGELNKEAAL